MTATYPMIFSWTLPCECPNCGSKEFVESGTMEYRQYITVDEKGDPHWGNFLNDNDSEREQTYECAECGIDLQAYDDEEGL